MSKSTFRRGYQQGVAHAWDIMMPHTICQNRQKRPRSTSKTRLSGVDLGQPWRHKSGARKSSLRICGRLEPSVLPVNMVSVWTSWRQRRILRSIIALYKRHGQKSHLSQKKTESENPAFECYVVCATTTEIGGWKQEDNDDKTLAIEGFVGDLNHDPSRRC